MLIQTLYLEGKLLQQRDRPLSNGTIFGSLFPLAEGPKAPEVLEHFSESSETGARETGAGGLTASTGADAGPLFSCQLRFS